jgi:replicative DNA helicase
LEEIHDDAQDIEPEVLLEQLEEYLKLTMFQRAYKEVGKKYQNGDGTEAMALFYQEAKKIEQFTLKQEDFIDVVGSFRERYNDNKERHQENSRKKAVTSFYIPQLDEMNHGRNLRGQETLFLAQTGVGKSHVARWIGSNACYTSGLNVLHIQLEGKTSETTDAYSAGLVGCESYLYESGLINEHSMQQYQKIVEMAAGTLVVRGFPKFGKEITTIDIKNVLEEYRKKYGYYPDVLIIDSVDLLGDSTGRNWGEKGQRFKRIQVSKDLKDIADDYDLWCVGTYQANISDPKLTEDENFVLTEYNCSEAKGLAWALTHLISLNQTSKERKERTMRLYTAKSRFFPKGEPFRIATDYEHEKFIDVERTMNMAD